MTEHDVMRSVAKSLRYRITETPRGDWGVKDFSGHNVGIIVLIDSEFDRHADGRAIRFPIASRNFGRHSLEALRTAMVDALIDAKLVELA